MRQAGATLHRGAWASHYRSLPCCGAQAPDAQAQQLWLTGPVAPRHVGSSQTRARTRVPCISRQILNHCATREAPGLLYFYVISPLSIQNNVTQPWAEMNISLKRIRIPTIIHRSKVRHGDILNGPKKMWLVLGFIVISNSKF